MANNKKKRYIGLIGLYVLLVIASSLIQQIKYYGLITWILIVITILLVIVLWTYLLRKNIVNVWICVNKVDSFFESFFATNPLSSCFMISDNRQTKTV